MTTPINREKVTDPIACENRALSARSWRPPAASAPPLVVCVSTAFLRMFLKSPACLPENICSPRAFVRTQIKSIFMYVHMWCGGQAMREDNFLNQAHCTGPCNTQMAKLGALAAAPAPPPLLSLQAAIHKHCREAARLADARHVVAATRYRQHPNTVQRWPMRPIHRARTAHPVRSHHVAFHAVHSGRLALSRHVQEALHATSAVIRPAAPRPEAPVFAAASSVDVRADD